MPFSPPVFREVQLEPDRPGALPGRCAGSGIEEARAGSRVRLVPRFRSVLPRRAPRPAAPLAGAKILGKLTECRFPERGSVRPLARRRFVSVARGGLRVTEEWVPERLGGRRAP